VIVSRFGNSSQYDRSSAFPSRNLSALLRFFFGGGGYVTVEVSEENDERAVEVESREVEHQARRFLVSV